MRSMLSRWVCDRPALGIVASISGFGASLLALLSQLSVVLGFLGAVFGLAAGYYTYRIKRAHWKKIQSQSH